MPFVVTSERDAPAVRYEKVGRLYPGEDGMIEVIRDGVGVIGIIPIGDVILVLNGLSVPMLSVNNSGKMMVITGTDGRSYFVLVKQVRGMIRDWPKKKAAVFWEMGGREGNSGNIFNKK
jgi:hypothetical protein